MKKSFLYVLVAVVASLLLNSEVRAQGDVPRYEIGVQFSLLSLNGPTSQDFLGLRNYFDDPCKEFELPCKRVQPGFGARFTYNLTNHVALEAEGNFFPGRRLEEFGAFTPGGVPAGHTYQGQFGVKAGKRFKKFGIFGKIRPGFVGFTQASRFTGFRAVTILDTPLGEIHYQNAEFRVGKVTYPSADVGGVVEFYPSRRTVTRFDVGDTIIGYGVYRERAGVVCVPFVCPVQLFQRPAEIRHNLQFSAGIGFRF